MKKRPLLLIILVIITTLTLFAFPGSISAADYVPNTTHTHYCIISSPFNEPITIEKNYNNYADALSAAKNMAHVAMYRADVQSKIATLTNEGFINYLYDGLFHRTPEEAGLAGWLVGLNEGLSRSSMIDYFINSPEFEMRYVYGYSLPPVAAVSVVTPLAVGVPYRGGIIAYIFTAEDNPDLYVPGEVHGIIAASADQSTGIAWITGGSTQSTLNTHTLTAIGTGQANTNAIIAQAEAAGNSLSNYAASLARAYTVTVGVVTYADWFLPSQNELYQLWYNLGRTTELRDAYGFASDWYWSSSESSSSSAWSRFFDGGAQYEGSIKNGTRFVRAVRAF